MNAIATIDPDSAQAIDAAPVLILPDDTSYQAWIGIGRNLANQKRNIDWLIGDWLCFGQERFPEQIALDLPQLVEMAGDQAALKRIEKTVKAFPAHLRVAKLSFDHHAHLADMPTQEALPLLGEAASEKWTARKLRIHAMLRKVEIGQILPREDDPEDDAMLALVRAWNRAPRTVREDFAEMVAESGMGVIEP